MPRTRVPRPPRTRTRTRPPVSHPRVIQVQRVILRGKRFTTSQQLVESETAMTDTANELIEAAEFALTGLPRKPGDPPVAFELTTHRDFPSDGIWTILIGKLWLDWEGDGDPLDEVIDL
jgi:hypothetical protein